MAQTVIGIQGMTCDGCVRSVTKALQSVPGVQETHVSLEKHEATVIYDDSKTSVDVLQQAVEEAGYDVRAK